MKQYEIERKFLLDKKTISHNFKNGNTITQGYIFIEKNKHIRVRIVNNKSALLCFKEGSGIKREEIEFKIPLSEGKKLLSKAIIVVNKIRTQVVLNNKKWDVDYYPQLDLLIGEVELNNEKEKVSLLDCVIKEVTENSKYSNIKLGKKIGRK
jgi:adenylate cyclase